MVLCILSILTKDTIKEFNDFQIGVEDFLFLPETRDKSNYLYNVKENRLTINNNPEENKYDMIFQGGENIEESIKLLKAWIEHYKKELEC